MADVVTLDATGSAGFADRLRRLWDEGHVVAPIDPRLPPVARDRLLATLRPTAAFTAGGRLESLAGGRPAADGDALVMATSGTTGAPKGVILTHRALEASAEATNARLGIDPRSDRWLACLPLAHMGGLGVVVRALASGTPMTIAPRPDADTIAAGLATGCTRTALVATVLGRVDTSGFTTVLVGGGPAPGDRAPNVVATYGLTETAGGVVYDGVPLDGVEVAVVDGIIRLRCPMVARAYRLDAGDERATDADGWFTTGDAGQLGPDGLVTVLGRVGDVINTGGEKVWPQAVEPLLARHPGVAEVAVVGRADPEWGQAVVAVVVPRQADQPPTLDELRQLVRSELPPWAAPRHIELVAALPRTSLGKVVRSQL